MYDDDDSKLAHFAAIFSSTTAQLTYFVLRHQRSTPGYGREARRDESTIFSLQCISTHTNVYTYAHIYTTTQSTIHIGHEG